jgi:multidrug efflux pump subunit AcrA (membrane-fusion protein)
MEPSQPQSPLELQPLEISAAPPAKRQIWRWLIPIALLGVGFFAWRSFTSSGNAQAPSGARPQQGPPPRPVELTTLQTGNAETRVKLNGQVEASQQSTIRAQTTGVVQEILVQAGDRIARGQAIATLDDSTQRLSVAESQAKLAQQRSNLARLEVGTRPEIIAQRKAALNAAEARERAAQDNFKRSSDLVREGAISQRLLVEAQAGLDTARAQRLEAQAELAEAQAGPIQAEIEAQQANVAAATAALNQAQLDQSRTQVIATAAGTVQTRRVSQGDLVQAGGEIVTLIARDQLDIFLEVPENLTGQVRPGSTVELTTRGLPNWKQRSQISAIVPSADPASRRQRVRVQISNPPPGLVPGMAVEAALIQPSTRTGFIVSRDVLTQRRNQWFVFTIEDDKAKPVRVEMIADMGQQVAIVSPDLRAGQAIVSRGGDGLQEGAAVRVVKP